MKNVNVSLTAADYHTEDDISDIKGTLREITISHTSVNDNIENLIRCRQKPGEKMSPFNKRYAESVRNAPFFDYTKPEYGRNKTNLLLQTFMLQCCWTTTSEIK